MLTPQFVEYLEYEGIATGLLHYQPQVIPGLLQTENYARTVSGAVSKPTSPVTRDLQIQARMARRGVLERAETHFVLDESVFLRGVDPITPDGHLMQAQVEQLRQLAGKPQVTIQVLPFQHSLIRGLDGAFTVLEFPDLQSSATHGLVYMERSRDPSVVERQLAEVDYYRGLFEQVAARSVDLESYLDAAVGT